MNNNKELAYWLGWATIFTTASIMLFGSVAMTALPFALRLVVGGSAAFVAVLLMFTAKRYHRDAKAEKELIEILIKHLENGGE